MTLASVGAWLVGPVLIGLTLPLVGPVLIGLTLPHVGASPVSAAFIGS